MSEPEDLELEALQRQLDDAFATTRPRRDFEDELWLRMQAKRPVTSRLRDAIATFIAGIREAPAVPMGAVAVLLVVVVGAGIFLNSGVGQHKATGGAFSQAEAPGLALSDAAYGRLPTPALRPGAVDNGVPNALAQGPLAPVPAPAANLYFGPATLRWTGQLPLGSLQAPVYHYVEPGVADADQFAASLGASSPSNRSAGFFGLYSAQDFNLSVRSSVPILPREPVYVLTVTANLGGAGDAQAVAGAFLDHYSLAPQWPASVVVTRQGSSTLVLYQRSFPLLSGGNAYLVDWDGERYGIQVWLDGGRWRSVTGPMPLPMDSASYRLITNDEAVRMALAAAPATTQALQPQPTVDLTKVELVYALAISGSQGGYYEPAYLFSGTFQYNGQTYTKRVLVPLVDPTLRSS